MTQKIFDEDLKDSDFIAYSNSTKGSCISLLKYRNGKLFDKLIFPFTNDECDENITESFMGMYYTYQDEIPKNIYIEEEFDGYELINKALTEKCGYHVKFIFPKEGKYG